MYKRIFILLLVFLLGTLNPSTASIELKVKPQDVYASKAKSASFKVNAYYVDVIGQREFIASQTITLKQKSQKTKTVKFDLDENDTDYSKIEVDIYNTEDELLETKAYDLNNDDYWIANNPILLEEDQLDYIAAKLLEDKISFSVNPSNRAVSSVKKNKQNKWHVDIPVFAPAASPKFAATGDRSAVLGHDARASGEYAVAIGNEAVASGYSSMAVGHGARATASRSYAFGENSEAKEVNTYAFGTGASAQEIGSVAIGMAAQAKAAGSFIIGTRTQTNKEGLTVSFNTDEPSLYVGKGSDGTAGNVGIATNEPDANLRVVGKTKTDALQMPTGARDGYVLTSDDEGNASWQASNSTTTSTVTIDDVLVLSPITAKPDDAEVGTLYVYQDGNKAALCMYAGKKWITIGGNANCPGAGKKNKKPNKPTNKPKPEPDPIDEPVLTEPDPVIDESVSTTEPDDTDQGDTLDTQIPVVDDLVEESIDLEQTEDEILDEFEYDDEDFVDLAPVSPPLAEPKLNVLPDLNLD